MANVVAYPDISLDKFTGLDPSEDARDFIDIIEQKMQFSLGTRPTAGEADARALYDARKRALFGSVLRGPAAQWFTTVPAADEWPDIRDAFIIRFTDDKDKYRQRIEVENIKRQPNELLKSYIHRLTKAIERGWPDPDYNNAYRENKGIEFFVRGLTPPGLKQKAHQYLIENPANTYEQLRNHISTKDLSFAVSSEFTGNSSSSIDNKIEIDGLKDQIRELTSLMRDQKINAAYDANNPRNKQNQTRFCKHCRKSGHTIAYCFELKRLKEQNRQPPQNRDKFTDNYRRNRSKSPFQQRDRRFDNRQSNLNRTDFSRHASPYPRDRYDNRHRSNSYDNRDRRPQGNRHNESRWQDRSQSRDRSDRFNQRSRDSSYDRRPSQQSYRPRNVSRENSRERNPQVQFAGNTAERDSHENDNYINLN